MVSSERGQLILVGAITIALVILGLVLIVNTALFTQIVGSEGTVESAKDGGVSGQEVGNAIGAVVAAENRKGGDIDRRVRRNVSDHLQAAFTERNMEHGSAFVNVTYLVDNETGTLIRQNEYRELTDSAGSGPLEPVTGGDVGQFLLTVDTSASAGENVTITVSSPSYAADRSLTVDVNSSGGEVALGGDVRGDCSDIDTTSGTVRIDAYNGQIYEGAGCQFDLFGGATDSYTIEFSDVDGVNATYSIATDQSFSPGRFSGDPSSHTIIWSFEYAFEYDVDDATVESEHREVDVYD